MEKCDRCGREVESTRYINYNPFVQFVCSECYEELLAKKYALIERDVREIERMVKAQDEEDRPLELGEW